MAITFDGVDDFVNCGSSDILLPEDGAHTISAWIKTTDNTLGQVIVYRTIAGSTGVKFNLNGGGGDLRVRTSGVTSWGRISNAGYIANNTWYHVLSTTDGSTTGANRHIYVNGAEVAYSATTNGDTPADNAAASTTIGMEAAGSPFSGSITEVAIWNVVLSAANIASLYGGGNPPKGLPKNIATANLKGYWPMNDGASGSADGALVHDLSGNGNDGTGDNGANNTGLTWLTDPLGRILSPLTGSFVHPTKQLPKGTRFPSPLTGSFVHPTKQLPKGTRFPNPSILTSSLIDSLEKVTAFPNAQSLAGNVISVTVTIGGGAVNYTFIASPLTGTFVLNPSTESGTANVYPQPISLLSILTDSIPKTTLLINALTLAESVIGVLNNITALPNALNETLQLNTPSPSLTILPNSTIINTNLPDVDKRVNAILDSLALTLNKPVENINISIPVSALSGIFSLQGISISTVLNILITPEAFILTFNLPDSREMIVYKLKHFAMKHDINRLATDINARRLVSKSNLNRMAINADMNTRVAKSNQTTSVMK